MQYRAHLDNMDLAADQYSFNNHAHRRFVEKVYLCSAACKQQFDANPRKYGY
jgi:hypothetical protein